MAEPLKLHLGCGMRYFEGYVNIDFPPSHHNVQNDIVADQLADIRELVYPEGTIDEVRLHHVFEHFTRPVACGLAAAWRGWLRPGGLLRIEVPDFDATTAAMRRPFAGIREECVGARHIFGSNEAEWAVHYDGWSTRRMKMMLETLDFEVSRFQKNSWKGTHNFEVYATAGQNPLDPAEAASRVREWLGLFLIDDTPMELAMLDVWMADYSAQLKRSSAAGAQGARPPLDDNDPVG